jgi:hypothetical protein
MHAPAYQFAALLYIPTSFPICIERAQRQVHLQGAQVQARLLAKLRDAGLVVLGERAARQDGVCHLRLGAFNVNTLMKST